MANNDSTQITYKNNKPILEPSAAYYLQGIRNQMLSGSQATAISTGFSSLDKILGGGLYEGLYILGAISSLGKTTLVCQIADQIAVAGQDVVIFSLEMSRMELIAKSLSRLSATYQLSKKHKNSIPISARQFMNEGQSLAANNPELFEAAFAAYGKIANHIYIYESIGDTSVKSVQDIVKQHIENTGNAPVVIVDYLQILAPYSQKYSTDKQNIDKTVLELKRLSRDARIPVIGISSLNRMSYKDPISMAAFKESGSIEYSSDVLIGLQLQGIGTDNFDVDIEKQRNPRKIELKILKNRNGQVGTSLFFGYRPKINLFTTDDNLPFPDQSPLASLFNPQIVQTEIADNI